jgi:transcriptional regulator with XRE-family HTH domain
MPEGSLAYRLRVARLEKGLTLREAAKVTGVDKATISAVERNKRKPFDVTLSRLAKGYGVSISQLVEEPIGEEPGQPLKEKAREWFQEAGGDRNLLHGMDDEAWEAYVENLDTPEEVSETYHKMQDERKMFQAFWMADRMQRPHEQGPRRELARGLRELRMSRYRDLAGQAAQLRARDLVEEIFDGVTEEEQELMS